jgi:hypothetical protein
MAAKGWDLVAYFTLGITLSLRDFGLGIVWQSKLLSLHIGPLCLWASFEGRAN